MGEDVIQVERNAQVATLWLNRPERRNAVSVAMCMQLNDALDALGADDTVAALLVRARGTVFSAGADLHERKQMTPEQVRERRLLAFAAYDRLEAFPKPCVAVVEGAAIGAGAEIATACDFIVATPAASFRYPEVGWGTVGATQRLPEIVGKRMAKELLFTGRAVTAAESQVLGIVNRVVAQEDLEAALDALGQALAAAPARALALVKQCVNDRYDAARRRALDAEREAIGRLLDSDDWRGRLHRFGADAHDAGNDDGGEDR